jgi:hypothetical protein
MWWSVQCSEKTVVATVMNLKKKMFAKRKPFRQATFLFFFIIFLKLKYIQITRVQFSQKSRANQQLSGHQSPRAYQLAWKLLASPSIKRAATAARCPCEPEEKRKVHTFANLKHEYGIKVSSAARTLGGILTQALLPELKNAAALTKRGNCKRESQCWLVIIATSRFSLAFSLRPWTNSGEIRKNQVCSRRGPSSRSSRKRDTSMSLGKCYHSADTYAVKMPYLGPSPSFFLSYHLPSQPGSQEPPKNPPKSACATT